MSELKAPGKSFAISKQEVWEAWEKVRANKGTPGVDGCSVGNFEADLRNTCIRCVPRPRTWQPLATAPPNQPRTSRKTSERQEMHAQVNNKISLAGAPPPGTITRIYAVDRG